LVTTACTASVDAAPAVKGESLTSLRMCSFVKRLGGINPIMP
jgi:hypothetical protein